MKRCVLMFTLMTCTLGHAQETAANVGTASFTGKEWRMLPEREKVYLLVGYLSGYRDGLGEARNSCRNGLGEAAKLEQARSNCMNLGLEPANLTVGEWMAGVDRFYASPKNEIVEFWLAVGWVSAKANGVTPEKLEDLEELARKLSTSIHEADKLIRGGETKNEK